MNAADYPINQTARTLYYADEALVALFHAKQSNNSALDPAYALRMRIAYEVSKAKLLNGNVTTPYGI